MSAPHLSAHRLTASSLAPGRVAHGFFGRAGGVSDGIFSTLNCGLGSSDAPEKTRENRARAAAALASPAPALLTLHQVHSGEAVIVEEAWSGQGPKADGMATRRSGLALGVLAADCMPVLFADAEAGVIGAAHAGWRGALAGVLEATIAAMTRLGARPGRIAAALGPCLRPPNFEVGLDLVASFVGKYPQAERFFLPAENPDKRQLDLSAFGRWRCAESGVADFEDLKVCTLARGADYFSYRASRRAGEPDYGRNLSAIALL
jgi:hypothetical protein